MRNPRGYSANVQIHLMVDGHALDVAQLLGNTVTLRKPIDHPAVEAELILKIDASEKRWVVQLLDPLTSQNNTVSLRSLLTPAAAE